MRKRRRRSRWSMGEKMRGGKKLCNPVATLQSNKCNVSKLETSKSSKNYRPTGKLSSPYTRLSSRLALLHACHLFGCEGSSSISTTRPRIPITVIIQATARLISATASPSTRTRCGASRRRTSQSITSIASLPPPPPPPPSLPPPP